TYITTAIPYVNAAPHIGFAMELVLADVQARYHRLRGSDARFLTGTDENSLKNVLAAEAEGISTAALVERNAASFRSLRESLDLSFDDFIRTSAEPRHRAGVDKLWQACAARGDIYKRGYRGLYCVGCEQFYAEADLVAGSCPEHGTRPELVEEENYFFRLSRYQAQVLDLLESGTLRVVPEHYRNEVIAFVKGGLEDFSISRSSQRARGWGIPVAGDPSQVIYVWFDALGNYITALDYAAEGPLYEHYWRGASERVHVIGKGITRFHAVYWPAMLLSAGVPLPTTVSVHGYLTVEGQKIGKSLGNAIAPEDLVARFGGDTLRYFLCRHIRSGRDGDFSAARVSQARDSELADQLGNLLKRTVSMISRYYDGRIPPATEAAGHFAEQAQRVRSDVERAFANLRIDDAIDAVWSLVATANKYVVERAPWTLARHRDDPTTEAALATTLYNLAELLRIVAHYLGPFLPRAAAEIRRQLGLDEGSSEDWETATQWGGTAAGTAIEVGPALFPKA
ncbi:MAG: methionine--tRNA ligase, partial [Myxococcota bacterium]